MSVSIEVAGRHFPRTFSLDTECTPQDRKHIDNALLRAVKALLDLVCGTRVEEAKKWAFDFLDDGLTDAQRLAAYTNLERVASRAQKDRFVLLRWADEIPTYQVDVRPVLQRELDAYREPIEIFLMIQGHLNEKESEMLFPLGRIVDRNQLSLAHLGNSASILMAGIRDGIVAISSTGCAKLAKIVRASLGEQSTVLEADDFRELAKHIAAVDVMPQGASPRELRLQVLVQGVIESLSVPRGRKPDGDAPNESSGQGK